ncbi:hypothetical protein C7271_03825 [filamentous cyanobacterium CCP5]|nr:hypothetical protein C7293_31540 [filamentous cyanobacterium CCT1]PSN20108.1 hypothetical protein C7271_03825 [filamentous cyanobacterium CCP5]
MVDSHVSDRLDLPDSDLIIEEIDDDTPLDIDPEKRRVKTEKQDLPVETLVSWENRGKINLQPDFQRNFVWNTSKASRLVESLLLDIPLPVIYVAEERDRTYSVVDGQQRLTSICSYVNGKFPGGQTFKLSGLKVLTELNRKGFSDLSLEHQEEILNSILRVIIIERDSDPDVKFEVFERLNLGAEKLNDQEVRNCVYRGNYNELLRELVQDDHLLQIFRSQEPHTRMADRQLILRFFALWRHGPDRYKGPMKRFLNTEMENYRHLDPDAVEAMRAAFKQSIEIAYLAFGENAFRRYKLGNTYNPNGSWEGSRLNVALWDTLLYGFSQFEKEAMVAIAWQIREEFLNLIAQDSKFSDYISSSTDKVDRIQYRAQVWQERLLNLIESHGREPLAFTAEFKASLLDRNPSCQICWKPIEQVDDAVLAFFPDYWRENKSIPTNARLDHRFCHRSR